MENKEWLAKRILEVDKKVVSQREEIRRLQNRIHTLKQSRYNYQEKAKRFEERLRKALKKNLKLKAKGGWISVEERLPDTTLKTITICDQDIGSGVSVNETVVEAQVSETVAVIVRRHIDGEFKDYLDYDNTLDGVWVNNMGVTHWMPLPEVQEREDSHDRI